MYRAVREGHGLEEKREAKLPRPLGAHAQGESAHGLRQYRLVLRADGQQSAGRGDMGLFDGCPAADHAGEGGERIGAGHFGRDRSSDTAVPA